MGQPVRVVEKPSKANPGTVWFETNRPLSGMGHRSFNGPDDVGSKTDPADVLASRLFERGGVDHVHLNGSVVTVNISEGHDTAGISDMIAAMFLHYPDAEESEGPS